ncbi:MAG: hypothetical protein R2799_02550, partial [Crocinitomicaceae bacterium]
MLNKRGNKQEFDLAHPELIFLGGIVMGGLFRVMHWPHGNRIMAASLACFTVIYLIRFFRRKKKPFLLYLNIATLVVATVNGIMVIYYMKEHILFKYLSIGFGTFWLVLEGLEYYNNQKLKGKFSIFILFKNNVFTLAMIVTGLGVLFKIMHWPGGGVMLLAGMGTGAILALNSGSKK